MIAAGKGVLRSLYCNDQGYGDFMPVDIAINGLMISTWNYIELNDKEHNIINFTSSQDIRYTWAEILDMGRKISLTHPANGILWYPGGFMTKSRWVHNIRTTLFQWIPAAIIDTILVCTGWKPV